MIVTVKHAPLDAIERYWHKIAKEVYEEHTTDVRTWLVGRLAEAAAEALDRECLGVGINKKN